MRERTADGVMMISVARSAFGKSQFSLAVSLDRGYLGGCVFEKNDMLSNKYSRNAPYMNFHCYCLVMGGYK